MVATVNLGRPASIISVFIVAFGRRYFESYLKDDSIVIEMEYCVGGSVADVMRTLEREVSDI